jgi:DNA polymerase III subunit epsilon
MYAIVDIETTGGSPVSEKITEIAVFIYDGEKIVDELSTLINPEKKIPYYITALTGITNAMVAESPKFYEVARRFVEITQNCIFVAHNVSFDYQFIRNEFKRLGYEYSREKLCTVQLSRKLVPGLPSYSLGKICNHLNINIHERHRAGGDALATTKLFEYLLKRNKENDNMNDVLTTLDTKNLHPDLKLNVIVELPEATGTYYFYNDQHELIYIGKSKNIRNRVMGHFRNFGTKKSIEMRSNIAQIDFEITGSELIALLKESHEIKKLFPTYNRSQRKSFSHYGLYHFLDDNGYVQFAIGKNNTKNEIPLCSFQSQKSAKKYLHDLVDSNQLCQRLCGLYPNTGSCFSYEIGNCLGACIGKETPESYNQRAYAVINSFRFRHESFFILDNGRSDDEVGIIQIECGKYMGYGFMHDTYFQGLVDNLGSCIHRYDDNRDVQQIIRHYLQSNTSTRIIPYNLHNEQ